MASPGTRSPLPLAAVLLALACPPAHAQSFEVGSRIASFALEDQHGQSRVVDANVRAILFSRDMDGGAIVKEVLAEGGAETLEATATVYVADVSGMPGIIRRIVAEPRMRKRPYPMLLDRDGELTRGVPSEKGKATLLVLERLRVVRIEYFAGADALAAALARRHAPGS